MCVFFFFVSLLHFFYFFIGLFASVDSIRLVVIIMNVQNATVSPVKHYENPTTMCYYESKTSTDSEKKIHPYIGKAFAVEKGE